MNEEIKINFMVNITEEKFITLSEEEARALYEKLKVLFDNNQIITTYPWSPGTPVGTWKFPSTTGDYPIKYQPDVSCGPYDPNIITGRIKQ